MANRHQYFCSIGSFDLDESVNLDHPFQPHEVCFGRHEQRRVSYLVCKNKQQATSKKKHFLKANDRKAGLPPSFAHPIFEVYYRPHYFKTVEYIGSDNSLYEVVREEVRKLRPEDLDQWFNKQQGRLHPKMFQLKLSLDLAHLNNIRFCGDLKYVFAKPDGTLTLTCCSQFLENDDAKDDEGKMVNTRVEVKTFVRLILQFILMPLEIRGIVAADGDFDSMLSSYQGQDLRLYRALVSVGVPQNIRLWFMQFIDSPYLMEKLPFFFLCQEPSIMPYSIRYWHIFEVADCLYQVRDSRLEKALNLAMNFLYGGKGRTWSDNVRRGSPLYKYAHNLTDGPVRKAKDVKEWKERNLWLRA